MYEKQLSKLIYLSELVINSKRYHENSSEDPAQSDGAVCVRLCLPGARVERPADGEVAFQGDGHQGKAAHGHADT